ncbi:MAG: ABC transporter permease [Oscillospiraceae bacterium]|nr:ABC transporter permease [Oscillospiraceae bacterium]
MNIRIRRFRLESFFALGALTILCIIFSIFARGFNQWATALNIFASSYAIGFLAIGVTFVIITGGIDLSIGTVMMSSALIGGFLYQNGEGLPLWICLIIIVLIGTAFGTLNGLMVTKLELPPFIATLGTMMVAAGLGSIITSVQSQRFPAPIGDSWFTRTFFRIDNFPVGAIWLFSFLIIALIVLNKTKLGRYTFAIGSNEEAVRLSGVKASNWKCIAYVISGFCAGFGAIFHAAAVTTIVPNTGQGTELQAIAAVVIGGTSLKGGSGSLTGTIIGVFFMSVLRIGLQGMGINAASQVFFTGIVVIGAVLFDIQRTKRANQVRKVKPVVQKEK